MLFDVQVGLVVLYCKFVVGEIIVVKLCKDVFDIDLYIKLEYCYLLINNSVFWVEGGVKVKFDGNGFIVQVLLLVCVIKGVISFDNFNGSSVGVWLNNKCIFYVFEMVVCVVGG